MNVGLDHEIGTVPLAEVVLKTEIDHDRPSKQTPQLLSIVIAKNVKRPSLPTFEGTPVDIRVILYDHIFIADADISLRSVPAMRAQIVPRRVPCLPLDMWHCKGLPNRPHPCNYMLGETTLPVNGAS